MMMLCYKAWRESSVRFLIGLGVIALLCAAAVILYPTLMKSMVRQRPYVQNYAQYLYWQVYGGAPRGMMQTVCLLVGLGGLQRDRKQGTLGFTLKLPVWRSSLIASRALVGFAEVAAISAVPAVVLGTLSFFKGLEAPPAMLLPFIPLWIAGGFATFAISFLCSVVFQSEYTSLAVAYVTYFFYLAATRLPTLRDYPLHIGYLMSGSGPALFDWQHSTWIRSFAGDIVVGLLTVAIGLIVVSGKITARQDL